MAFTYFFRDLQALNIMIDKFLPHTAGRSSIKIWDAGCASGEEPYTMAILLAEKMDKHTFKKLKIFATDLDISNQFAKIIADGVYPYDKLKRMPEEYFKKYFSKYDDKNNYQIADILREKIIFRKENLLTLKATDTNFSGIICKNVLLHQSPAQRIDILKMFHQSLADNGILVMEHTQKIGEESKHLFEAVVSNAQVYKKR